MIALPLLALAVSSPDPEPLRAAVEACDRTAMTTLARAEPRRRAEWAEAVYKEQRAIAADRAAILPSAQSASGAATLASARQGLEARQEQLNDARAVERAWREFYDEYRADFLSSCSARKRDGA
ncbi:hypothetical protein B0I00_2595 [Novosphingobium kunmingense]|uniref:LTXXQ motif family protein n=1 Tax=Novosphingobium kunmingense TaxID=1211806 RepID=A0A2N0H4V3_9SPHN|nr:hypothetical protein [Novosphingobium kunmingense]PKB13967.1 hypothetical protein B0I00_2595 [Novosphingobium kunmingense]